MLNPSGSIALPASSPLHNFRQLISRAAELDVGVVAIRILGGGVLGGIAARQGASGTTSSQSIHGLTRSDEFKQANLLGSITGDSGSDVRDLAVRFAIANKEIASALVGFSTVEHLEAATKALAMGPPTEDDLRRLNMLWTTGFE
jgi:aryl-alcohol dehydrogenase-like predicted oxidoreductase